ncbi:MAG TPA: tRNA (adenosine(37)-N6)-threonylcarbamoyltransferase complex ATPase subunit type 1 TsaE [Planctomycetota bacterium]|nr:tRNA (adenosine(37)-N6)-threonylcarbamoyltransferase complex ATPase subunit type 1 TsaE [Planctomycetota bacterium]
MKIPASASTASGSPLGVRDVTSPVAMEALGRQFGEHLLRVSLSGAAGGVASRGPAALVLGLEGDLGAGKTTFVRGLVAGVTGGDQRVTSPTFQLMNLYRPLAASGRTLAHIDAYRLTGAQAFAELGLADLIDENVIIAVEWPDRTHHPIFTSEAVYLRFTHIAETIRRVELLRVPVGVVGLGL